MPPELRGRDSRHAGTIAACRDALALWLEAAAQSGRHARMVTSCDTSDVSNRIVAFISAHADGQQAAKAGRPPATKS
jgi:hypothetical protein